LKNFNLTKICTKCKIEKEICEFHKHSGHKDGFATQCKDCKKNYDKNNRLKNIKKLAKQQKTWRKQNPAKVKKLLKKWRENHKEKIQKYREDNKEYFRIYRKLNNKSILNYFHKRYNSDINFRLKNVLRSRLYQALSGNRKNSKMIELLNCSIEKLKNHLQSQFVKGMTWDNYGKWHIDHIKPCAKFDLSKAEEQQKCFHYTNLQPLWAIDNIKKGCK